MSDGLIERLETELNTFVTLFGSDPERLMVMPKLKVSELIEILSALKTARGIEGLAKRRTGVHIYYQGGEWFVGETTRSIDLHFAVDAAVGESKKGEK